MYLCTGRAKQAHVGQAPVCRLLSPVCKGKGVSGKGMKLRTGMAVCIEPMFNLGGHETMVDDDHWTVRTADGTLSAHWEHTVCITPDGVVVTTVRDGAHIPVSLG